MRDSVRAVRKPAVGTSTLGPSAPGGGGREGSGHRGQAKGVCVS